MNTECLIRNVENVADKHRNDVVLTFGTRISDMCDDILPALKKLKEYEDLEKQGLLLRLPCKKGDMVWDNDFAKPCSYEVTGFSFGDLDEGVEYCEEVLNQVMVFYSNSNGSITGRFAVSEIGRTVFLTEAEAKQAIAKSEAKDGTHTSS